MIVVLKLYKNRPKTTLSPLALALQPAPGLNKVLNIMTNWAVLAALVPLLTALVAMPGCHAVLLHDDEGDLSRIEDDITVQGDERKQYDSSRSVLMIVIERFVLMICSHFGYWISGVIYACKGLQSNESKTQ